MIFDIYDDNGYVMTVYACSDFEAKYVAECEYGVLHPTVVMV